MNSIQTDEAWIFRIRTSVIAYNLGIWQSKLSSACFFSDNIGRFFSGEEVTVSESRLFCSDKGRMKYKMLYPGRCGKGGSIIWRQSTPGLCREPLAFYPSAYSVERHASI
jgi:hypothetical protein